MTTPEAQSSTEPLDIQQKTDAIRSGTRPVDRDYPYIPPDYRVPFLHIGSERQLFLDNFILDHLDGVSREDLRARQNSRASARLVRPAVGTGAVQSRHRRRRTRSRRRPIQDVVLAGLDRTRLSTRVKYSATPNPRTRSSGKSRCATTVFPLKGTRQPTSSIRTCPSPAWRSTMTAATPTASTCW